MPGVIEKTTSGVSLAGPAGPLDARGFAVAAGNAMLVSMVLLVVLSFLTPDATEGGAALALALGLLPVHVGGLVAALLVLVDLGGRGRLVTALQLGWPCDCTAGELWRLVAARLLWVWPATVVLTLVVTGVLILGGGQPLPPPLHALILGGQGPGFWLFAGFAVVVFGPMTEEVLFRVILHDALLLIGPQTALVVTSLIFATIHGNLEQAPALFMLAVVLQHLRARTHSLWPAMALHALFNVLTVISLVVAKLAFDR